MPILVAVNFWNPLEDISLEQLMAVFSGQVTTWEPLTGIKKPVKLLCTRECMDYVQSAFSTVSPERFTAVHRQELLQNLVNEEGALAIFPWVDVDPKIKVVAVKKKTGAIHPFWSADPEKDYPLTAQVRLLPSGKNTILRPWYEAMQKPRIKRILQAELPADRWVVGKEISTLAAAGDLLFDRKVARTSKQKGDLKYPLAKTAQVFRQADLAFANLECPLSSRGRQINMFRGKPAVAEVLADAGFDVISLANNHIFDYGLVAFLDSIECLQEKGIIPVGVGENIYQARAPKILSVNGVRVAFLAYTRIGPGMTYTRVPQHWAATVDLPGVAEARSDFIRMDVARAKAEADLVFVSFHWGNEYVHYPTDQQKAWGKIALAAGADLVLGHHPHVLQGIEFGEDGEVGKKGIIVYSLGNFVFDQITFNRRQSMILKAAFTQDGICQLCPVPVLITAEQPSLAEGSVKHDILRLLAKISFKE